MRVKDFITGKSTEPYYLCEGYYFEYWRGKSCLDENGVVVIELDKIHGDCEAGNKHIYLKKND